MRTKGGGTEQTDRERETEKERLHFEPTSCGCVFGHQAACFQKGPVKEGAFCPLPARVIRPGNQSVVHRLWDSHPCIHQSIENCRLRLFPGGLLLAAGKYRQEYWGDGTSSHCMTRGLNCCHPCKSFGRDPGLPGVRGISPPPLGAHQGEPVPARVSRPHKLRGEILQLSDVHHLGWGGHE